MVKLILVVVQMLLTISVYAQKDVTKFLGIPVDGSKSEMIQNLKAKGFTSTEPGSDMLEGEFNGTDVYVSVVTNNNKVWRIAVVEANSTDVADVKNRYNILYGQFKANEKYIPAMPFDQSLDVAEDITYEMFVNKKRYDIVFYQKPKDFVQESYLNELKSRLLTKFTEEQLANPDEEQTSDIADMIYRIQSETFAKKSVWFTIAESLGKYFLCIYYDNGYNMANGEDL